MGNALMQSKGSIGGAKSVFVKLAGNKNELVFPTHGGYIKNPFATGGKIYAGDLLEYRTDDNGENPVLYIFKSFEVADAATNTADSISIVRDGFHHVPSVGDVIMKAPSSLSGTGTAVKVTSVTKGEGVWTLALSATLGVALVKGDILVEGAEAGSSKKMLVTNPNAFAPCDYDLLRTPAESENDFEGARYFLAPVLHGIAYKSKMSKLPSCVNSQNRSKVNGWFEL